MRRTQLALKRALNRDHTGGSSSFLFVMVCALAVGTFSCDEPATGTPDAAPVADVTDVGIAADTSPSNMKGAVVELGIEAFDVASGTERQVCRIINIPGDTGLDLVEITSLMQGTSHHFNVYKVIDDSQFEPVTTAESTVHDCVPGQEQLDGEAAYIFGAAEPARTFATPKGVAIRVEPGQRLILEQHVINYTPNTIQGGVELSLTTAAQPETIEHYADIIWFNWIGIFLPPGKETSSGTTCTVPYDVEVIGLMSHFHERGTHFQVNRFADGATQEVLYEDTDWAHPKYQVYPEPISLKAGDGLTWTCTWFNNTDANVSFGQTSNDEMCITFALAYPKNSKSGDPIQCNQVF